MAWWRAAPPPPLAGLDLTQLTFDAGYSGTPALSPDGTLLAFASDRAGAGNLDIWVQPVAGGAAIQVTRDTADERMPVFAPDGGRIVFRVIICVCGLPGHLFRLSASSQRSHLLINRRALRSRPASWRCPPVRA